MKVKDLKETLKHKKEYSIGICAPISFAIVRVSEYIDVMGIDFKPRHDVYAVLHASGKGNNEPFATAEDLLKEIEKQNIADDATLLYEDEHKRECYARIHVYDGSKEINIY